MTDFLLPSAATHFRMELTIRKELRPYLTKWFNATKKENESVEDFVLRNLGQAALQHRLSEITSDKQIESQEALDLYRHEEGIAFQEVTETLLP